MNILKLIENILININNQCLYHAYPMQTPNEQTIKILKTIKRSVYKIDFPETINHILYRNVPHEQPFPPF
jgi:hypothetical protein